MNLQTLRSKGKIRWKLGRKQKDLLERADARMLPEWRVRMEERKSSYDPPDSQSSEAHNIAKDSGKSFDAFNEWIGSHVDDDTYK